MANFGTAIKALKGGMRVARKAPILNTFYLQSLGRYMELLPPPR